MADRTSSRVALGGVVAAITALYLPSCLAVFGFKDDYEVLWETRHGGGYYFDLLLTSGRPLNGLLTEPLFVAADTTADLRWIRAVGVVGVIATATVLMSVCRRARFGVLASVAVAMAVAGMPSTVLLATWAVGAWQVVALATGVGAGLLLSYGAFRRDVAAAVLLALSLSVYQPSALASVPVFLFIAIGRLPEPMPWKRAAAASACGGVLYALTTAAVTIGFDVEASERAMLPTSWSRKLVWFSTEALPASLDPVGLTPIRALLPVMATFLVGGVWLAVSGQPHRTKLGLLTAVGVGWVVTLMWALVLEQDVLTQRIRLANHVMFVLLAATAIKAFSRFVSPRLIVATSLTGVLIVLGTAAWRLDRYVVKPRVQEEAFVARMVAAAAPAGRSIAVVTGDVEDTLAPATFDWEYGFMSSALPQYAEAMVGLLSGEQRPVAVTAGSPMPDTAGVLIDLSNVREDR